MTTLVFLYHVALLVVTARADLALKPIIID
jgi:hypothetical protein